MTVAGGATAAAGTAVQLSDCNGTRAQRWVRQQGLWLFNAQSSLCLDVTGGDASDGTPLQMWHCNGSSAQQWNVPAGSDLVLGLGAAYEITFQAPDSRQWFIGSDGVPKESPSALAPGTSPSIVNTGPGDYESAFVASDGTFWTVNSSGGAKVTDQFTVSPGTSPSIAASQIDGHWMTDVQAASSRDWQYDSASNLVQTASALAPGTSPSIAGLADGSFEETFVASSGLLWVANSDPRNSPYTHLLGNGLGVAAGTDPAIASMFGTLEWVVAFQGGDHHLWTVDWSGNQQQWPYVLEPTSGVAINYGYAGGFVVVFKSASDGLLRKLSYPDGAVSLVGNGLGMAAHTRPAIAQGSGEIVFHASEGGGSQDTVWVVDSNNVQHSTGQHIAANTSPAITWMAQTPSAAPSIGPLQVSGNNVTVTWQDRSTNESLFFVQKRTALGEWHDVYDTITDNPSGTGQTYSFTDTNTDTPISPRCYRVYSASPSVSPPSPEQCNLPSLNIPATLPSNVLVWHGLSSSQDGTGTLATFNPLVGKDQSLAHAGQTFGVNLGFQDAPAVWTVEGFEDRPQLTKGQLVALNVAQGGWLKKQDQDFSIDLGFDSHPAYEWVVLGNTQGEPLAQGNFALWNIQRRDFLVFCDATASVTLCWRSKVNDPAPVPPPGPVTQPAAAQFGVGFLRVFNCSAAGHAVSVWVKDTTTGGSYQKIGSLAYQANAETGCVAKDSQPLLFTPTTAPWVATHNDLVVVTDPQRTGCTTDNPANTSCVLESRTITGNPAGAIETTVVGVGTERSPFAYNALTG